MIIVKKKSRTASIDVPRIGEIIIENRTDFGQPIINIIVESLGFLSMKARYQLLRTSLRISITKGSCSRDRGYYQRVYGDAEAEHKIHIILPKLSAFEKMTYSLEEKYLDHLCFYLATETACAIRHEVSHLNDELRGVDSSWKKGTRWADRKCEQRAIKFERSKETTTAYIEQLSNEFFNKYVKRNKIIQYAELNGFPQCLRSG